MNKSQEQTANTCSTIIESWVRSNDLSSPTNASDIGEFVSTLDIPEESQQEITNNLSSILLTIKNLS